MVGFNQGKVGDCALKIRCVGILVCEQGSHSKLVLCVFQVYQSNKTNWVNKAVALEGEEKRREERIFVCFG